MVKASQDVDTDRLNPPLYFIPAPTGSGKTTFTCALIAAAFNADPGYSAAIATETIAGAVDVYGHLSKLIPMGNLCIYTSAHAQGHVMAIRSEFGDKVADHVERVGRTDRAALGKARIAICTHELARREHSEKADFGVQHYMGQRRSNVIWDEQPSFVTIIPATRTDIVFLSEKLRTLPDGGKVRHVIHEIEARCRDQLDSDGPCREAVHLISRQEFLTLKEIDYSAVEGRNDADHIADVLRFLDAASLGNCFIDRGGARGQVSERNGQRRGFVAYKRDFRPHPGIIVLDATSKVSPVPALLPYAEVVPTPEADYRNLQITHIEMPEGLKNVARRTVSKELNQEFIRFVRSTVSAHSQVGDDVLVVLHKHHIESDPSLHDAQSWRGRNVSLLHWGRGIGANDWQTATHVFLFSEFHIPRSAHVAEGYGLQGLAANTESFGSDAIGQVLKGAPAQAQHGHLLRWFKQLACRGRIRNIDNNGICRVMKLFTTMNRGMLMENFHPLFPGAPLPEFIRTETKTKRTKGQRLADYLIACKSLHLCATKAAEELGIKVSEVGRAFASAKCKASAQAIGWSFTEGNGRKATPYFTRTPIIINIPGGPCLTV